MWVLVLQQLFFEVVLDIIYFPLWWYTIGAAHAGRWCWNLVKDGNDNLAPGIWLANLFTPMFGQTDWEGRIISFFMRLVQIIFRSLALAVWAIFCLGLFFIWLVLPIIMVWGLVHSLSFKNKIL